MNLRTVFEAALAADPLDVVSRCAYADWLQDNGCDDEAAEQRRMATPEWLEAARWLTAYAEAGGTHCPNYHDHCDSAYRIWSRDHPNNRYPQDPEYVAKPDELLIEAEYHELTLADMVAAGRDFLASNGNNYFCQLGDEGLRDNMWKNDNNLALFWQHWQTVTGDYFVPDVNLLKQSPFTCSC